MEGREGIVPKPTWDTLGGEQEEPIIGWDGAASPTNWKSMVSKISL